MTPVDVALLLSPDSAVVVVARGRRADVAESQAVVQRWVELAPCSCPAPGAWTFLEVVGPAPGRLTVIDGSGRRHEPGDPCAFGRLAGRSPFARSVALNFAFYGVRPESVLVGEWRDVHGLRILHPPGR